MRPALLLFRKEGSHLAKTFNGKRPKNLRHTISRLFAYFGRHKHLLLLVGILAAVSAIANLLGTYMIRPVVNQIVEDGSVQSLLENVLIAALIFGTGALSTLGYTQLMVRAAQKVLYDIRRDLYTHLQKLSLNFFDSRRKGDLMSLFTNDVDTISDALNNSFALIIQSFIQVAGTLALLFFLNWRLSLLVILGYLAMFLYIRYSTKQSKRFYDRHQAYLGELDAYIEEMAAGQKVVKVFNHEKENLEKFIEKNKNLQQAGTRAQGFAATMIPAVVSISYINYAVISVVGGIMVIAGWTDLGSLASYLVFVRQAAMPINQFTQQGNFLLAALAGAERVFDVMEEKPETDEGTVELVNVKTGPDGALTPCKEHTKSWAWYDSADPKAPLIPLKGDVRFNHVTFGYQPEQRILNDISLYAKPGQKIAFVGSTGAGKTTITNLINRFYDISKGEITYDGIDVRKIRKDDLRRSLGIVLQDTHLFTGTIADNIRFGKLDATQEEIENAARIANADSFIRRLPKGYDTMVTSDGANLSQGQRQLLAIARAAVADPPVLILDEATSSIDTRTEALIEKGMDQLMEGRTVFVIAHRLSTVRNSNAIMVLEHGKIMERGDHDELLAQKGIYYQLYNGMFELS